MAKIINLKTPEIMQAGRGNSLEFITVVEKGFYISKPVAKLMNLKDGVFVHFVNDATFWAFYINNDKDGFKAIKDKDGFVIYNRPISRMFKLSIQANDGDRFFVHKTNAVVNGCPLFEIATLQTVEVVIEKSKLLNEQKKRIRHYIETGMWVKRKRRKIREKAAI